MKYQCPKGLFDILPYGAEEAWQLSHAWLLLEEGLKKCAFDYGFKELRTPIFEHTELFCRGVGETTDIVTKEMYTFKDKAERSLTLRPEGTASLIRAFVERNLPPLRKVHKFFYIGPMFRYERPQAGRFRQLHQFGIETLGPSSMERDAETLDLLHETMRRLKVKNLTIAINSIGDVSCREKFRSELKKYLEPNLGKLSSDSQARFTKNPLRILDSKAPEDQPFIQNAPSILDFLDPVDGKEFETLQSLLKELGIPFVVEPRLVRGLDYYDRLVFEMRSENLGAQNALGGGGRYTSLSSDIGGPDIPGVGFAMGLERILQVMIAQGLNPEDPFVPFLFIIPMNQEAKGRALKLATDLRRHSIPVDIDLGCKKLGHSLKNGDDVKARFALILGEEELEKKMAKLKNLSTREQSEIDFAKLEQQLTQIWEEDVKIQKNP